MKLWKFNWDCGRMGDVEGIFIATQAEVDAAIGMQVSFGEILGKHSDIHGLLDLGDVECITDDATVISVIKEHLNGGVGYNPLEYLRCEHGICLADEVCEDCEE